MRYRSLERILLRSADARALSVDGQSALDLVAAKGRGHGRHRIVEQTISETWPAEEGADERAATAEVGVLAM